MMSGKIFINYRRGDDPGFTQALYMRLEGEFGAEQLFMDVEGYIKPGDDFVTVLEAQVAQSDVVLAVIGPRWMELMGKRAQDADDFVAIEIKAALGQGKRVIPVLVGGADMPRSEALPDGMRDLARRNAVGLRPERFKVDCQGLVNALKDARANAEREMHARNEAERAEVEQARRKREADEAERLAALEAKSREQRLAGLSVEDIRKAEELANWDFVKESEDEEEARDHLARFPGGVTEKMARAKLEKIILESLRGSSSLQGLKDFLAEFPSSSSAPLIKEQIKQFKEKDRIAREQLAAVDRERKDFARAMLAKRTDLLQDFLKRYPKSELTSSVNEEVARLSHHEKASSHEPKADSSPVASEVDRANDAVLFYFALTCLVLFFAYAVVTGKSDQALMGGIGLVYVFVSLLRHSRH